MSGYFDKGFGNWLPDDEEIEVIAKCKQCSEPIYEGDSVISFDGDYYCCTNCLMEEIDAKFVEAECEEEDYAD